MCWASSNNPRLVTLVAGCVVAGCLVGCATTRGVLFEPIDPPKVWPAPPDTPRIKLIGALSSSEDLKASKSGMESFKTVLRGPRPPIKFSAPQALAVHADNTIAVADGAGAAVHIIDLNERTHARVIGWDDQQFAVPIGAVWVGDRLFVTDAQRHEVIELDVDGRFRGRFGSGVLVRPVGIAFSKVREKLYVVDGGSHCLKVFDLAGNVVRTIGRQGINPGEFNFPSHICCSEDRLIVADSGNFRVQWLNLDGEFIRAFGRKGDGAGDLSLPKGVALDSEGHLYVVDAHFENVQIFNSDGQVLMAFGEEGRDLGQFWLPAGLAIDGQDRIWIADPGNGRIQMFEYMRTAL
ncbi:MAG: hypothetical protein JSU63_11380 [Phycisphaerales bacterium]|nr:MAG: hypothetical protein JSU63_11380 [Phycisphaerales bacterium]